MAGVSRYEVQSGDWLAKIAQEYGSTVSLIWNHPLNAEHRARRGSPDVLYPGDILYIPSAATALPSVPPAVAPPAQTPPELPPADVPPWPYPPLPKKSSPLPRWACPDGLCSCHPSDALGSTHLHRIVFRDGRGRRMPNARCMVYERGRPITSTETAADASGELEIELSVATTSLWVEWAPPELPHTPGLPFGKRYHLVDEDDRGLEATQRRLENLGFGGRRGIEQSVRAFQTAAGSTPTGAVDDTIEEVLRYHHEGRFAQYEAVVGDATGFDERPELRELVGGADTIGGAFARVQDGPVLAPDEGGGGGGLGGTVVAETTYVMLLVGLDQLDTPLDPKNVTARLLPRIPGSTTRDLIQPMGRGAAWSVSGLHAVLLGFENVPAGDYTALVHLDGGTASRGYALGRQVFAAQTGVPVGVGVHAQSERPILTVHDPLLDLDVRVMQRRRKVLATIFHNFPRSANFQAKALGFKPDYNQGEFQRMLERPNDGKSNSCTAVAATMLTTAAGPGVYAFDAHKSKAFVPYESGRVPSVGDNFVLFGTVPHFERHHTGLIMQSNPATNSIWLTADGGQRDVMTPLAVGADGWASREPKTPPSDEAAFLVPRMFGGSVPGKAMLANLHRTPGAEVPNGYFIEGWLDITHPSVSFSKLGYDSLGTEQDFLDMRKRVTAVVEAFAADRARAKQMQAPP